MKLSVLFIAMLFVVLCSCNSVVKQKTVSFGIYETVKIGEVPVAILDTLQSKQVKIEKDPHLSIIGYIPKADSVTILPELSGEKLKYFKTFYAIDNEHKYCGIIAVKANPAIVNSDIKTAKCKGNKVEIYFNSKGANRWAELTKKNSGNNLAFILDKQVYAMPMVNGEIRNGVALIDGLENETLAKSIAESLNP